MGNIFNDDFRDFIKALNINEVEYLLVGGYAVILHGYRRTTGDMDIWVNTTLDNLHKLKKAFLQIFITSPVSIDIMKAVKGLQFDEAFSSSEIYVENDLQIRLINYSQLIN